MKKRKNPGLAAEIYTKTNVSANSKQTDSGKKSGERHTVVVLGCVPVNPTEIVEMKMRRLVGRRIGTVDDGLS